MTEAERTRSRRGNTVVSVAVIGLCGSLVLAVYAGGTEGEQRSQYSQNLAVALRADGFDLVPEAFGNDAQGRPTADVAIGACALKHVRLTYERDGNRSFDITDYHFEAFVTPYSKPDKQLDPFINGGELLLDFRNSEELRGMVGDACIELEPLLNEHDIRTMQ